MLACYPLFTCVSSSHGVNFPRSRKSIPELALNFKGQEYECRLKVIFTPETQTSSPDYDYILLDLNVI